MDRPRKIAFISCSATKRVLQENEVVPAKDLYTSTLFRLAWRYAEEVIKADRIYILSAKHHLLHPEKMIGTYNETLKKKKAAELKSWSNIVLNQMGEEGFDFYNDQFYVLAGKTYYKYLVTNRRFKHITCPYANCKGIGFILQFLKNSLNQ